MIAFIRRMVAGLFRVQQTVNACIDCRHFNDGFCDRTARIEYDRVTGVPHRWSRRVENERSMHIGDVCGRAGKYWVLKVITEIR